MKLNIKNFRNFIRKATLNMTIDSVRLIFEDGRVRSSMKTDASDAIVLLNLDNNIIDDMTDEQTLNFNEPRISLIRQLDLIDTEEADISIARTRMTAKSNKQKSLFHFCTPQAVSVFQGEIKDHKYDIEIPINKEFVDIFTKIKKFGNTFGKVYISVNDGIILIESTDKSNKFADSLSFEIGKTEYMDFTICFDFQNFVNVMAIIDNTDFNLGIIYSEEKHSGVMIIEKEDKTERYILTGKINDD